MVHEWLPPFRSEPARKAARWVLQSVVDPDNSEAPLWEAGISTEEYEARLERPDLCWAIRASAGRGKHVMLARLSIAKDQPGAFQIALQQTPVPETLFNPEKLEEFLNIQDPSGSVGLLPALLASNGFEPAS